MRFRLFFWKAALIALIAVTTVIALALGAVAVLYTIAQFRSGDKQYPPRDELQRYLVLGYPVNIPQGYRDWFEAAIRQSPRTPQPWVIDTVNKINLEIVYPTMAMPREWDPGLVRPKVEGEDIVAVIIDPVPGYGKSVIADLMHEQVQAEKCAAKRFGDICTDPHGLTDPINEMVYLGTGYDFAQCTIDNGRSPYPQCRMIFMLVDNIAVDFHFTRRILTQAPDIRRKIFTLVCSWFEWPHGKGADPAGHPLTIDYCR